jgi:hypothetical protein
MVEAEDKKENPAKTVKMAPEEDQDLLDSPETPELPDQKENLDNKERMDGQENEEPIQKWDLKHKVT